MATSPTQVRIDSNVKAKANELFKKLGIDMSSSVNILLRQCVLHGGLPFKVEIPKFNAETLAAMEESIRISRNPNAPSYSSMEDLKKALLHYELNMCSAISSSLTYTIKKKEIQNCAFNFLIKPIKHKQKYPSYLDEFSELGIKTKYDNTFSGSELINSTLPKLRS